MTTIRVIKKRPPVPQNGGTDAAAPVPQNTGREARPAGAPKPEDDELKGWGDMEVVGDAPVDV